jgi:hypothetical protein
MNRAEFVMLIINPLLLDTNSMGNCLQENVPDDSTIFFSDVSKDAWYGPQLCIAKTKKIIDGYPNGMFRTSRSINFAEAAKIICNIFSLQIENETTGDFWYEPYVKRLAELHAIPTSITQFNQVMTRGEIAEIVYRLQADQTTKASASFSSIK